MQLPPDNSLSHHMQHKTKNVKVDSKNHSIYIYTHYIYIHMYVLSDVNI